MADREKVIRGLEQCVKGDGKYCLLGCPYFQNTETTKCFEVVAQDALELLKEQQPKTGHRFYDDNMIERCSECKGSLPFSDSRFCPHCGAEMLGSAELPKPIVQESDGN